ncbi:MAG TPA: helix-turn-helix transcriptional regulator [Capsulimonadaceae bacterium]|nr:helix-turn-helix transcriptional regulator [Capsulimonadaceae bacterium]
MGEKQRTRPGKERAATSKPEKRQKQPAQSFGQLIAQRRRELGLTQAELGQRIKGRRGGPVTQNRITDIEHDRFGAPRLPVLKQLARALQLDLDVLYLWSRRVPDNLQLEGLSEETIKQAWQAFRAVIERARQTSDQPD